MGAVQDYLYTDCMAGFLLVALLVIDHNGGTYDDLGSRRCAGGTDPEYFGYTVCRTGSCILL